MVLSAKVKKSDNLVTMPYKKPKRKKLKFKLSGPAVIVLLLLGFIFYSFGGQMVEMYNVQHEIKKIQGQMEDLQSKNAALRKQIEQLNSTAYLEREAREKLGLVKPGEKIILEAKPGVNRSIPLVTPQKNNDSEVH